MNELIKATNAISNANANEVSTQIMAVCRAITPQFYKGQTDLDLKTEKMGIDMLTSNIEPKCLGEMCRLAVLNYPRARSENEKTFFDINYILTFYKQAFNSMFCEQVELPSHSEMISSNFDNETNIITEKYQSDGKLIEIREIVKPKKDKLKYERIYSSKYFSNQFNNLDDIEI